MPKSKNVRKQPEITPWKRWKLWLSRNEKILWVVLLILIAPMFAFTGVVSSFLTPNPENTTVHAVYYGDDVTYGDLRRVSGFVGALRQIAPSALAGASELVTDGPPDYGFDPYKYILFKKKAERLGIRVSDTELAQRIRQLWREGEATRLASEEIRASGETNQQQLMMRFYQLRFEKQQELDESDAFDSEGWKSMIKATGQGFRHFERTLRDFYTVVKLQDYVSSSVKVSPQEVYEEFKKDRQKRRLSWAAWKPPAELTEKISSQATDEDLKAYYGENKVNFYRPLAVSASYVIVPAEHFKAEAEKSVTDKDLEDYYSSHLNDYRTGAILAEEAAFVLRTEEEQKEFESALYQPFDEVKDDVREKFIDSKSKTELQTFTNNVLRQKLFPAADSGGETPSLEELKAEYPYLETGTTEYATRLDAEDVLGDAYTTEVNRWFRELDPPPNSQTPAKTEVTPPRWAQTVDAGRIFYTNVDVRQAYQPEFDEVASEVREAYTTEKALETLGEALEKKIGGDAAEPPPGEEQLASLLSSGVEVQVGDETLTVRPESPELVTATEYVRSSGLLRYVPVAGEESEDEANDEAKDAGPTPPDDDADDGPEEEVLASSRAVCDAAFDLDKEGEVAVARDPDEKVCYLVRFDDVIYPDPSEFETSKGYLESRLLRDKRGIYIAEWYRSVVREASPGATVETPPAEDVPAEG